MKIRFISIFDLKTLKTREFTVFKTSSKESFFDFFKNLFTPSFIPLKNAVSFLVFEMMSCRGNEKVIATIQAKIDETIKEEVEKYKNNLLALKKMKKVLQALPAQHLKIIEDAQNLIK